MSCYPELSIISGFDPNWIVAIATFVYAVLTWFIWRNSQDTLRSANKTHEETKSLIIRTNNSYVGIKKLDLQENPKNKGHFGIRVRIHNYGQTPASQMKIYFLAARNRDILYKKGGYSKESFPAVLLPNGTLGAFHDININTYIEAKNGDGLFFLKIKILYTGIDEEEYVFYSFNSYNKQGGYFDVDESYLGKVKDSEKHVR